MVDYATVRQLHRAVADELAELLRQAGPAEKLDPTALGEQLVARHVKEYVDAERLRGNLITDSDERALQDAVAGELVGLGRLKILLADPQVENIHVLGYDRVRVERSDGSIVEAGPIADSDEELLQLLQTLARQGPVRAALTTSHLLLDRELVDAAGWPRPTRSLPAVRGDPAPPARTSAWTSWWSWRIDPLIRDFSPPRWTLGPNIIYAGPADAGKTPGCGRWLRGSPRTRRSWCWRSPASWACTPRAGIRGR